MPRWSEFVEFPDGTRGIICYSGKQRRNLPSCRCGKRSTIQCDFPLLDGRTCDRNLCRACAVPVGPNRDYCAEHPQ